MVTFLHVVENGSFTATAELEGVPKSRISQRISDLERHLGVRLLHRTTRTLRLTEDGRAYHAKCEAIIQDIDELEAALKGAASEPRGTLRVEALASIARWILAPRIHEFCARYPGISLRLGSSDHIRHLLEEGIDCAIRGGRLESSSQIARHVCDVRLGLYAAPAYLGVAGMLAGPENLADHQRISWFTGRRAPSAWRLVKGDEQVEIAEADALRFDDPDVAIESAIAGAGICPAAPFAAEKFVRAGQLTPVLPEWSFEPRPIHIIYPSNRHLSARVRCFVDWSAELMRTSQSLMMTPLDLARVHA